MGDSLKKRTVVWTITAVMAAVGTWAPVTGLPACAQELTETQIPPQTQTGQSQGTEQDVYTEAETAQTDPPQTQPSETSAQSEPSRTETPETQTQMPAEEESSPAQITTAETTQEGATEEASTEEVTTEEATTEEATTEEATTEEETTQEATTEEASSEEPETEEEEWSETVITEDNRGLTFTYSEDGGGMAVTGFDGSRSVVEIPQTYGGVRVTSIGAGAFRDQTMITSVILPEGLVLIGREAFAGCVNLTDIRIPESLEQLGAKAFDGTPWDDTLTGDLVYINKILYRCQTDAQEVAVADGTRVIAEEAFAGRTQLQAVTIPEGVTYIGSRAFAGCSALSDIRIPESVQDIVANAFDDTLWYENRKDTVIQIHQLLYRVPGQMVQVTVPEGVTSICTLAFSDTAVQTVRLPSTLQYIRYGAFLNCKSLQEIRLPEGVVSVDGSAFQGCSALKTALLPQSLSYLGGYAFAGCSSLESIAIPEGISRINSYTFENCTQLTAVQLFASADSIGSRAFAGCSSLLGVTLPQTIKTIGAESFAGCSALAEVPLPAGLEYLGEGAFTDCSSLRSVQLPAGTLAIRARTFQNCTSLTGVTLPEGLKYIGEAAFRNDVFLHEIRFPESLLTICSNAFEGAGLGDGLVLPSGLRTLGDYALAGCVRLSQLTLPSGIRNMGSLVFNDCSSLNLTCAFSSTAYMAKLSSGWSENWADGVVSVTFTGGALSAEQLTEFVLQACSVIPDMASQTELGGAFYTQLLGRTWNWQCGRAEAEPVDSTWLRVSELSAKQMVNNQLGVWMADFYPQKQEGVSLYYEDGYYYIAPDAFADGKQYGYLSNGTDGAGHYSLTYYDAETGIVEGDIVLTLQPSDNDNGVRVVSKTSEGIGDAHYTNVYESEEVRELSAGLNGSWLDTQGRSWYFDNYSRVVTVSAGEQTQLMRYTCIPAEGYDFCINLEDLSDGEQQSLLVMKDAQTGAMEFSDPETLERQESLTVN